MKKEFIHYLNSVGMTNVFQSRVREVLSFYKDIYPEDILEIFVTDIINEDDERTFGNLWIFYESFAGEAKEFTTKDNFDLVSIRNRIIRWNIIKQDYDFGKETVTVASRLTVEFQTDLGELGDLRGSRENCIFLERLFKIYLLPNFLV